jgi:hypothetical protein
MQKNATIVGDVNFWEPLAVRWVLMPLLEVMSPYKIGSQYSRWCYYSTVCIKNIHHHRQQCASITQCDSMAVLIHDNV